VKQGNAQSYVFFTFLNILQHLALAQGCKNAVVYSRLDTKHLEWSNVFFTFCTSCIWILYDKAYNMSAPLKISVRD